MPDGSRTSDYDYGLPDGRIARHPTERRDRSRLLVLDRTREALGHGTFRDLVEWFEPGDLLVVNESRVLPARLRGRRVTGGRVEALLLAPDGPSSEDRPVWTALLRPGRKLAAGERVGVVAPGSDETLDLEVVDDPHPDGVRKVRFGRGVDVVAALERFGAIPLPPYMEREEEPEDRERYQTIYARVPGSVAAPTAGLHFTSDLLAALERKGVERAAVTLHVGAGTFRTVEVESPGDHRMHAEVYEIPAATAAAVGACRARGGAVWAVGTTVVRTLESASLGAGEVRAGAGETTLFLHPPKRLGIVDGLLTNFHLPRSTLMMLVACMAGYDRTMSAYRAAVEEGYRFYSYGDAMLIPPDRTSR